jgi:transcriptional regulator with XRE-family HTH domain
MRVAENLRRIRQESGLSYAELARRLAGLGHPILDTSLLKIEKGDRRVDVDDLVALAVALGTTPNRLLLPEMDVEHASESYRLTPAVRETPPLLWAWATGEVPLGHLPSRATDDRTTRGEEVVFSRLNRPHHWHDWGEAAPRLPAGAWTKELALARTGFMAYLVEAFVTGMTTAEIRAIAEAAFTAVLVASNPAALSVKIEASEEGVVIHLDDGGGIDMSLVDSPNAADGEELWPSTTGGT